MSRQFNPLEDIIVVTLKSIEAGEEYMPFNSNSVRTARARTCGNPFLFSVIKRKHDFGWAMDALKSAEGVCVQRKNNASELRASIITLINNELRRWDADKACWGEERVERMRVEALFDTTWQIVPNPAMAVEPKEPSSQWALAKVRAGCKVRRKAWGSSNRYAFAVPCASYRRDDGVMDNWRYLIKRADGVEVPCISIYGNYCCDWELYEEPNTIIQELAEIKERIKNIENKLGN